MRLLVIDDHPLFREGIRALAQGIDPGVTVTGFSSVSEALGASMADPDLVLLDMNLPGVQRLEALHQVKLAFESACVVIMSAEEDPVLIRQAIHDGASGYIPKTTDVALTVQALRTVLADGIYLPRAAIQTLQDRSERSAPAAASPAQPAFNGRQRQVLIRLLQGKSNKIIARELQIAEGTVKAYVWAIFQTMGVTTRAQAMYRAYEWHWLDDAFLGQT